MKSIAFIDNFIEDPINHGVNELVLKHKFPGTYHQPARFGFKSLDLIPRPDGIVLLGSASHVTENEQWHKDLLERTLKWAEDGVAVLGICFGHQLLSHHDGATVGYITEDEHYYQILREVEFKKDLWGIKKGTKFQLPYSHKQAVINPPKSFDVIATADELQYEILKHKTAPIWTMQCHPEASEQFIMGTLNADQETCNTVREDGSKILDGFIEYVLKV